MEFKDLNLHPELQRGIAEAQYLTCMPVQEQVLANAFRGQDLYVQSQTGTGKTAAFLIVIFQRLLTEDILAGKKAIIMVPTRELAVQVEEEAKVLGKYLPFKIGSFYGGVGYTQQQKMLRENVQILVGTPGRVLDLNKSGQMNLMDIAFLVLDEADRMFDMGFYPDLRKLIKVVPPADRRQTMLFSATLNAWVKNLAWEYTKNPFEIEIEPEIVTVEEVDQVLYHVPSEEKMKLLLGILEREKPESAIIFCNTKRYTEIVAKRLRMNGYECEFIIGDLPQSKRLKVIEDIKAGKIRYLVATDVAARGLDIEALALVVNYDLPVETENYVHRIGRTARAGKTGRAITLASEQDVYELPAIERYIGKKIPSEIATPELHMEDKSAGIRIHTEFYEDPRGERRTRGGSGGRETRDGRGGRTGESRHRESSRRDRARGGGREGFPGERGEEKGRKAGGGRRSIEGRNSASTGAQESGQDASRRDLSHLSFDERMAYYKQKYESAAGEGRPGSAEAAGRRKRGGQKSSQGLSRREQQEGRDSSQSLSRGERQKPESSARGGRKGQRSAAGRKRQGGQNADIRGPQPGTQARQGGARQGRNAAPARKGADQGSPEKKQGFLGKLLGIFRKK
ncbi:MAG: DEAD/DEAH box helicase [Treponema sp.]|jgi:ATP-dependent RNA helicase RhlB|nr:DEAD/DEAH box helicase [Treponema sp.]